MTRTIRHIDSHMEMEKIRKDNIKHLIFIALVFIITTFDNLRNTIWKAFSNFFWKSNLYIILPPLLFNSSKDSNGIRFSRRRNGGSD